MKKLFATLALALCFLPTVAFAQDFTTQIQKTGDAVYGASVGNQDLATVIGRILSVLLSAIGVVLLVIIIYAGFLWMTAGGNPESVKKAKSMLINAIVGVVILAASFAITQFVVSSLQSQGTAGTEENINKKTGKAG